MRYLINFIFDNLIPIIIVTSVVIRIITGMKKSASRRRSAPPVSAPAVPRNQRDDGWESDVWSRLKPDDDEDGEDDAAVEALPQAIRPLLMPAPAPELSGPPPPVNPDPGIARPFDPVAVGIEPIAAEPKRGLPRAAPGPGPFPLDRLNSLPPLRRAVVMAEILGKPRGMESN